MRSLLLSKINDVERWQVFLKKTTKIRKLKMLLHSNDCLKPRHIMMAILKMKIHGIIIYLCLANFSLKVLIGKNSPYPQCKPISMYDVIFVRPRRVRMFIGRPVFMGVPLRWRFPANVCKQLWMLIAAVWCFKTWCTTVAQWAKHSKC